MKKGIALLLALTLLLTGCGSARRKVTDVKVKGTDLMTGVKAADVALLLEATSPIFYDIVPLTLEEIFIYELGGADYNVKDILL